MIDYAGNIVEEIEHGVDSLRLAQSVEILEKEDIYMDETSKDIYRLLNDLEMTCDYFVWRGGKLAGTVIIRDDIIKILKIHEQTMEHVEELQKTIKHVMGKLELEMDEQLEKENENVTS